MLAYRRDRARAHLSQAYPGRVRAGIPDVRFVRYPFQVAGGGVTTLDTMPAADERIGYFTEVPPLLPLRLPIPSLDRSAGFTLSFEVRVDDELHFPDDRAGFSVIVLVEDLLGIELALWKDEIWAQTVGFRHGEGVAFDTTAQLTTYDLCIFDDLYAISADGTEILSGSVRDYSTWPPPYSIPNFVFLGDDTQEASARIELARVELSLGPCISGCAVPPQVVMGVQAVRSGNDVELTWDDAAGSNGYNVWYVTNPADIDRARATSSPPAQPVTACATPTPTVTPSCTDVGAIARTEPYTFYQTRVYCDVNSEGP